MLQKILFPHCQQIIYYSAHVVLMVRTNGVDGSHQWCGAFSVMELI